MKRPRLLVVVVTALLFLFQLAIFVAAQQGATSVDWSTELRKAREKISEDPHSAFWHNQAGVAYDALGKFKEAEKEFKTAVTLDSSNPGNDYALYFFYKRRGTVAEQRKAVLMALDNDPANPLGNFEFGNVLERERHWTDALRQYEKAKSLAAGVNGSEYVDSRGNPYDLAVVRTEVDKAIERVRRLGASTQTEK